MANVLLEVGLQEGLLAAKLHSAEKRTQPYLQHSTYSENRPVRPPEVMKKLLLPLLNYFSSGVLATSLGAFFVYGNYLKVHRSYSEAGQFKYLYYGMGRPIYISAWDYIILAGIGGGIVLCIIALYYLYKQRRD
jgi:hypothetical protein